VAFAQRTTEGSLAACAVPLHRFAFPLLMNGEEKEAAINFIIGG
jgi:hypothetical protein